MHSKYNCIICVSCKNYKLIEGESEVIMWEILMGIVSGIVTGIGMGGGTILILLLSIIWKYDQHIAQATNLIFFIPTSIISIIVNLKEKNINIKLAVILSVSGIIGAIIGAYIGINIDVNKLKKCFAMFLIIIAIHEVYSLYNEYIKSKNKA